MAHRITCCKGSLCLAARGFRERGQPDGLRGLSGRKARSERRPTNLRLAAGRRTALEGGEPVIFLKYTFDQWKARGLDEHSVIADPLFVDAKKRNFALKPDSPALKLGFRPIDLSTVGPRAGDSTPVTAPPRARR